MNQRFYRLFLIAVILLIPGALLSAEEPPAPLTVGDFTLQGSVTAGYRFTDIKGRNQKFLELFNLKDGFRLMDFNISGRAKEGASPFADSFSVSLSGLGGDPFPGGQLVVRKNKVYDLRVNYRQTYYYWDRNDDVVLPAPPSSTPLTRALTTNHDWATVRRFGSVNLKVQASNNLRFSFEYGRTGRDGVNFTTRTMEYFGAPSSWGSFLRANPYRVESQINEVSNRFSGGVDYSRRDWNLHYRLGYQTFEQNLPWNNVASPERSINVESSPTARELLNHASWSEFRRLKTPTSEFSYSGKISHRLELRGGYIFYRYRGPATMNGSYDGIARTNSAGTTFAPYSASLDSRVEVTEPNHVFDQGFSLKIKDWWNLHTDYRYSRLTVEALQHFHGVRDGIATADGELESGWLIGTHTLDVNMEFVPTRALIVRPGVRYLNRNIEVTEDGVIDPARTRKINTFWPILSVAYQPSKMFSVRGDIQSITSGASYTRISPHTDVGSHLILRIQPTEKISIEENLVVRNRKFQETSFQNNIRTNGLTVSYALDDRFSIYGGFSYDSYVATAAVNFLRGTAPLATTWRDQTVNRIWQAGLAAKPLHNFGINLSGNFVRTTGAGEISGEPPTFGPMTWPLITGTVYYDFPKAGRLSLDLQRTYYVEEIVRGNDFRGNLMTVRWTKDF